MWYDRLSQSTFAYVGNDSLLGALSGLVGLWEVEIGDDILYAQPEFMELAEREVPIDQSVFKSGYWTPIIYDDNGHAWIGYPPDKAMGGGGPWPPIDCLPGDPCCNDPDPCCGTGDPCCENPDPCCGRHGCDCDPYGCRCTGCPPGDGCVSVHCIGGGCQYFPINCNDGNPCTDDYCAGGGCHHEDECGCSCLPATACTTYCCVPGGDCVAEHKPQTCQATMLPTQAAGCPGGSVEVCAQVCHTGGCWDAETYTWLVQQTGGDAEVMFSPSNGQVTVPHGGCEDVCFTVQIAEDAVPGQTAQIRIKATSQGGGVCNPPSSFFCTSQATVHVLSVDVKSIEFTSDHNLLKKNPTSGSVWGDSSTAYETPEWVAGSRNNPISHTKNTKIRATVKVKVEPAGITFDLIGDGPDAYVDFEKTGQTSTGADQDVAVTAEANLPDQVCTLNKSISWKIKVGSSECAPSSSGSHTIYVTYGTPAGTSITEKRVGWACATCDGESSLSGIADDIYDALASEPPRFQLQNPNVPSPLWLLMESVSYQGQCIDLANLMKLQVEMIGGQGSTGYVYGSTDSDCFATSPSAYESRSCTNTNHPGSEVIRVWSAGDWNNWEAVCQVLTTAYAVKLDKGAALEILRNWLGSNTTGGNYQAWRYYDAVLQSWETCTDPGPCPVPKP